MNIVSNCWLLVKILSTNKYSLIYSGDRTGKGIDIISDVFALNFSNEAKSFSFNKNGSEVLLLKDNNCLSIFRSDALSKFYYDFERVSIDEFLRLEN